jgi:hypothetical protein
MHVLDFEVDGWRSTHTWMLKTPQRGCLVSSAFWNTAGTLLRSPSMTATPRSFSFIAAGEFGLLLNANSLTEDASGDASNALIKAPPCRPVAPVTRIDRDIVAVKRILLYLGQIGNLVIREQFLCSFMPVKSSSQWLSLGRSHEVLPVRFSDTAASGPMKGNLEGEAGVTPRTCVPDQNNRV